MTGAVTGEYKDVTTTLNKRKEIRMAASALPEKTHYVGFWTWPAVHEVLFREKIRTGLSVAELANRIVSAHFGLLPEGAEKPEPPKAA